MSDVYVQIIRNTRLRVGQPPRVFDRKEMDYLRSTPPAWCRAGRDDLYDQYVNQVRLLTEGSVVWGALVQANSLMFSPGPADSPGVVVYCPLPHWHDDLRRLSEIASAVMELKKGTGKNAKEKEIGTWLAGESQSFFAHPVPVTIAGDAPVLAGTLVFPRKHLPSGVLSNSYFPLFVHEQVKSVMVVPARYWDGRLVEDWLRPA